MAHRHVIHAGECIATVAFANGFFPDTIWNHPENGDLRERRRDGNVLAPGDVVFVPDRQPKTVAAATGRQHRYRRRGVPERFNVRLLDAQDAPRAGLPYQLVVDGVSTTGSTDSDGWVRQFIAPDAKKAVLQLDTGEEFEIMLGHLPPADTALGIQRRLANLGHPCADPEGELGAGTLAALTRFLRDEGQDAPPEWDEAAIRRAGELLRDRHGS